MFKPLDVIQSIIQRLFAKPKIVSVDDPTSRQNQPQDQSPDQLGIQPAMLVVGLGNPGEKYHHTRHNVGFWLVEQLAQRLNSNFKLKKPFNAEIAEASVFSRKIILAKPQTFMNRSGMAVSQLANYFNVPVQHILVLHDELDFQEGKLRLKFSGGHGGHNGLRDIHRMLNNADYWRCRIGIGRPPRNGNVSAYVLQPPSKAAQATIEQSLNDFLDIWPELVGGNFEQAMLKLHSN